MGWRAGFPLPWKARASVETKRRRKNSSSNDSKNNEGRRWRMFKQRRCRSLVSAPVGWFPSPPTILGPGYGGWAGWRGKANGGVDFRRAKRGRFGYYDGTGWGIPWAMHAGSRLGPITAAHAVVVLHDPSSSPWLRQHPGSVSARSGYWRRVFLPRGTAGCYWPAGQAPEMPSSL